MTWKSRVAAFLTVLSFSPHAPAHSFGEVYTLPVPFWLYAWGATAALIASFLVVGYFVSTGDRRSRPRSVDISNSRAARLARRLYLGTIARSFSVFTLLLCIATGLAGTQSAYGNFNMTWFWVVFMLGFAYLTALIGDVYAGVNPWKAMAAALARLWPRYAAGLMKYPAWAAYWPALILYVIFIWFELFAGSSPYVLSVVLAAYTAINFIGVGIVGLRNWFHYCEFLSVFFRLIAVMAPVDYRPGSGEQKRHLRLRPPFSGVLDHSLHRMSLLLFLLFMLSSTAFDGLHETTIWKQLFWRDLYKGFLQYHTSPNPLAAFPAMVEYYRYWQSFWLLASPFGYLAVYLLFVALAKWVTRSEMSVRALGQRFALSLLPIALVYHVAHYYTLIETQGIKIIPLISDPFGWGWNLFGTVHWLQRTFIPDVTTVWHVQVVLIVLGHIVSVYLAHRIALTTFPTQRTAVVSQLPMLVLMVLFTTAGLWILSQPMAG